MSVASTLELLINTINKENAHAMNIDSDMFSYFTQDACIEICQIAQNLFKEEPMLLKLNDDFIVVGDLHGHFFDLLRILKCFGLPPKTNYIFLGDTIDRGEFSLFTIISILTLKCSFPSSVFLIRGNHEFESINYASGLAQEIKEIFGVSSIYSLLNQVFSFLPISILLNNDIFCIHGGIGPKFSNIDQAETIARPFISIYGGIANAILWSDPSNEVSSFRPSKRGVGFDYGIDAVNLFFAKNKIRLMVRGHQAVQNGVEYTLSNKVVTVFSASNYCGEMNNVSGVLIVKKGKPEETFTFPPIIPYIKRIKKEKKEENGNIKKKFASTYNVEIPKRGLRVPEMKAFSPLNMGPCLKRRRVLSNAASNLK